MMKELAIGIDLGGTRIKAVVLDNEGNLLEECYRPTSQDSEQAWKTEVSEIVMQWRKKWEAIVATGVSAPGLPDSGNSAVAFMPGRLNGLEGLNWADFLGMKSFVLNDAVAALLAEARFGAAKNGTHVVMVTLGTGVGGAILVNGEPYTGSFGKAGHIGHMSLDAEGPPDICGMPGSLEDAIGNATVTSRSKGAYTSTHELLEAFRRGEKNAEEVWLTSVKKLGIALASITNILSPETIVIGGGIAEAGADLFGPLDSFMALYEWRTGGNRTNIVKAALGEKAGAIGAACFALETKNKIYS